MLLCVCVCVCECVTLSEGLLNVPSHAHQRVLRCVRRGRAGRVRVDRCGDRPADGVAGGRAWRARTLSLRHIHKGSVLTSATGVDWAICTKKAGSVLALLPML